MKCHRRPSLTALPLILLLCIPYSQSQQQGCDPCAATESADVATFKARPGTACIEYVQCVNGQNMGDFTCSGDTIYDQEMGYCNWPSEVSCVEETCPPTRAPTTDAPTPSAVDCPNPCPVDATGTYTVPGSRCKKYASCEDGMPVEELECFGDTLFNQNAGYCDWPHSYSCSPIECPPREPTELPTEAPTTESPTEQPTGLSTTNNANPTESADCPNPCPAGYSGFKIRPGTDCKKYVECDEGAIVEEMECSGGLVFNTFGDYCDWSVACGETPCPAQEPTYSPVATITVVLPGTPVGSTATPVATITIDPTIGSTTTLDSSDDCPNPCRWVISGLRARPGSNCKTYVQCEDEEVVGEFTCHGDNVFIEEVLGCENELLIVDWSCPQASCPSEPSKEPTYSPVGTITNDPTISPTPYDCPNPCPWEFSGLQARPGANCKSYVQCEDGEVIGNFTCYGDYVFLEEIVDCENELLVANWSCPQVSCPIDPSKEPTYFPTTGSPTIQPTPRPIRTPKPTIPMPTPMPSSTYQNFRKYLAGREAMLKSVVFQSNGSPSTAYTFPDFFSSLDVAVYQLPSDQSFFVGDGMSGRLPKLSGMEYGLVNLAAFLSNAMEEGIRIDSCDELNTDFMYDGLREKYPLTNACGQYGRQYEDEDCAEMEPFHCALNKTMEVFAVQSDEQRKAPPFECRAIIKDGDSEIFPGYYDSVDDLVIQSAYANTLGRTDLEGCCWWGRGVMLTRGRCSIGKLDKYIGQGAVDRGIFVYPDINFCSDPGIICSHQQSNELRWVLGFLEWSERVQSYTDLNTGWNYMDELKKFVDNGMDDDDFINGVINIFTRNCHNDKCWDQWQIDKENNLFVANRRDNFRRIVFEVWNLPMTYHPTEYPAETPTWSPTLPPTLSPSAALAKVSQRPTVNIMVETATPTNKPTRRKGKQKQQQPRVIGLPPNSAHRRSSGWLILIPVTLTVPGLFI